MGSQKFLILLSRTDNSIFQTVTSIQEQTLTFVPKILAVFAMMLLVGAWMLNNMSDFMIRLWSDFSLYV